MSSARTVHPSKTPITGSQTSDGRSASKIIFGYFDSDLNTLRVSLATRIEWRHHRVCETLRLDREAGLALQYCCLLVLSDRATPAAGSLSRLAAGVVLREPGILAEILSYTTEQDLKTVPHHCGREVKLGNQPKSIFIVRQSSGDLSGEPTLW